MTSTVVASLVVMLWAVGPAVISAAANTPVCTGYHQWNDGTNCNACTSRGCPIGMFRETCTSASRQDARSVTASAVWRIPNGLFFCLRGSWMMLSHSRPRKKNRCIPCSLPPANGEHVTGGLPYMQDSCMWACREGYYRENDECRACITDECTIPGIPCLREEYRGLCI